MLEFDFRLPHPFTISTGNVAPRKTEKELLLFERKVLQQYFSLWWHCVTHCLWLNAKQKDGMKWETPVLIVYFFMEFFHLIYSPVLSSNLLHFSLFGCFALDFHIQQLLLFVSDHNSMWNIDFFPFQKSQEQ